MRYVGFGNSCPVAAWIRSKSKESEIINLSVNWLLINKIWFTICTPAIMGYLSGLLHFLSLPCFWISEIKSSLFMGLVPFPPIKNNLNHLVSLQLEPVAQYLVPAWFQMHISCLAEAVWRPGIANIFSIILSYCLWLRVGISVFPFCQWISVQFEKLLLPLVPFL